MVENPRDEMFRMMNASMQQWRQMSRVTSVAGNVAKAGKGNPNKPNPNQPSKAKAAKAAKPKPTFTPDTTVPGEKKDMTKPMEEAYHPKQVEAAWYAWWEKKGFFHPDPQKVISNQKKPYVMVIPPPNVTGALHLGHALMLAIEDAVMRWRRMTGYEVLWLPGCDHAGIATQSVVEKQLWKTEKKTRHDLGRDQFVQQVWDWKESYGGKINNQFRRMGISVDWKRYAFTLDETRYEAVMEAFCRMYEKGLIYRDTRLVNWCCHLNTALSDQEVDHIDLTGPTMLKVPGHDPNKQYEFGVLTEFAYKIKGTDKKLVVATTRLETMLGDVAVAVHPNDPRYQDLIGKELEHPFYPDRKVVVVADDILVNMDFGTGAVKVTPAHDKNDNMCGKRHELPQITVIDEDGKISANGGMFAGMMRFDARNAVYEELDRQGLIMGKKPNPMSIGRCSKSNDIIEPLLKPQWYVNCKEMAARAVSAVRNGDLIVTPEEHHATWYRFLENIQDWCISRQLWWGHRIPVYLVTIPGVIDVPDKNNSEHFVVGRNEAEARKNAATKFNVPEAQVSLQQDEDVLDTWFSSGIFPMSTMGWPNEQHEDYQAFFPGHLLETGHDILFFWVARMVMMSLELTDKLPFKTVFLHPMVKDENGAKMSKSKGNVIDPLEVLDSCDLDALLKKLYESNLPQSEVAKAVVDKQKKFPSGIPECGTDALRFTLLSYMVQNSINLDVARVVGYREFCNKLWNIVKFALMNFPEGFQPAQDGVKSFTGHLSLPDKWILTRLSKLITSTNNDFTEYRFGIMVNNLYDFWKKDLADVYLEASKPVMKSDDANKKAAAQNTLYICLDAALKMLHPTMPYITEELFQRLPHIKATVADSICIAEFPTELDAYDGVEVEMEKLLETGKTLRSQLASLNVPSNARPTVAIKATNPATLAMLTAEQAVIQSLSRAGEVIILGGDATDPDGFLSAFVSDEITVYVKVAGLVDIKLELARIAKRDKQISGLKDKLEQKMNAASYMERVPEHVRAQDAEKVAGYATELATLAAQTANLSRFQ